MPAKKSSTSRLRRKLRRKIAASASSAPPYVPQLTPIEKLSKDAVTSLLRLVLAGGKICASKGNLAAYKELFVAGYVAEAPTPTPVAQGMGNCYRLHIGRAVLAHALGLRTR